jgi:hypothetical protein
VAVGADGGKVSAIKGVGDQSGEAGVPGEVERHQWLSQLRLRYQIEPERLYISENRISKL